MPDQDRAEADKDHNRQERRERDLIVFIIASVLPIAFVISAFDRGVIYWLKLFALPLIAFIPLSALYVIERHNGRIGRPLKLFWLMYRSGLKVALSRFKLHK